MKYNRLIQTPNSTIMVEINLENATNEELQITKEDMQKALQMLYDTDVEIIKLYHNNTHKALQEDLTQDYVIEVLVDSQKKYAYNFACCLIDSEAAKALYQESALPNIIQALQTLRGKRYETHPLYYNDYAQLILQKFEDAQSLLKNLQGE